MLRGLEHLELEVKSNDTLLLITYIGIPSGRTNGISWGTAEDDD